MSLQRRLTLIFILIVVVPLATAGFFVQRIVVGEIDRRASLSLDPALDASIAVYNSNAAALDDRVGFLLRVPRFGSLLEERRSPEIARFLHDRMLKKEGLDFLIALDPRGEELASTVLPGRFLAGFEHPLPEEILSAPAGAGRGFFRTGDIPVQVAGRGRAGSVVGGFWLDEGLLAASSQEDVVLSLASGGKVIASTGPVKSVVPVDVDLESEFSVDIGDEGHAQARRLGPRVTLIASTPSAPIASLGRRVLTSLLPLLLIALLATAALAHLLARLITQPLGELAEGAKAITEGRFDVTIPQRSHDEVGELAGAFNAMTARLRDTVTELSSSRDQLQRAVRRVGETLRSTHDMGQMLDSILNTSVDSVSADAGVLWRLTPTRDALYASGQAGDLSGPLSTIGIGEGAIGLVAERAMNVMIPGAQTSVRTSPREPDFPVLVAIPLYSQGRVAAVLSVYRKDPSRPFSPEDMDTVLFLAEQGGVAIENVLLHEEARRLSLTDGLTGVWNRRFFQMQFRQMLATATRFDRPFSLLMMDLDHFKEVNDTYGHQRGDAILVEFTQRVSAALREVDTFARYGGEEFICLLSETEFSGALTTAQKICDVIRSDPFGSAGEPPIHLTVSIGVSAYPDHGDTFRRLVETADQALYRAKQGGRNRVAGAERHGAELKLAT